MNYYKRNLGDFARDTAHLSQGQIGAYDLLLDWYYANERPLPADINDVYRVARSYTKEERGNTEKVLKDFFVLTPNGWVQKRAEKELLVYSEKADQNRSNGIKGGRPKKNKTEHEPKENPVGYFSDTETITETEPKHNLNTESIIHNITSRDKSLSVIDRFSEFWEIYPNKTAKPQCHAKWKAKKLDKIADQIIANIVARLASDRRWSDGFIPNPLTYLNQERWNDPLPDRKPSANGHHHPSITDDFKGKSYVGTPIDELPAELREPNLAA